MRRPPLTGEREEIALHFRARFRWVQSHAIHWRAASSGRKQARSLWHRARQLARGELAPRGIPLRSPTTPAFQDRAVQALANSASWIRRRAMARSPRHPRISPPFPALLEERIHRRRARLGTRRLFAEQGPWEHVTARPDDAVANKPRQLAGVSVIVVCRHRFQPRNGSSSIDDQDRGAALEAVDQGAQVVLRFGYAGFLHHARLAKSLGSFKLSWPL